MSQELITAAFSLAAVTMLAALGWLVRWAWTSTHKRIDDAWTAIDRKAPNDELLRVRDTQITIFDHLRQHDSEDRKRFEGLQIGMGRIEGKVDALLTRRRSEDSGA